MEVFIPITFFMCVTAVLLLRPISKRLGGLLEVMTQQRLPQRAAVDDQVSARTLALLDQVARRLDVIEERLDFTERLVSTRRPDARRQFQRPIIEQDELEVIGR